MPFCFRILFPQGRDQALSQKKRALSVTTWLLAVITLPSGLGVADGHGHNRDVQITILQTTDLHDHANGADHVGLDVDHVTGTSVTGAYARIAAYVDYVRDHERHPVLLVDSGDWTMGTLYDLTLGSDP